FLLPTFDFLLSSAILNSTVTTPPAEISSRTNGRVVLGALVLIGLWFVLCRQLSGEWSVNEQYSYGWFVPFFALFLFWLRWEGRPEDRGQRTEDGGRRRIALAIWVAALLLLLPVRLFEIANPDWRALEWIHALA